MADKRFLLILTTVAVLLISMPYLAGFLSDSSSLQFSGFLMNPIDGQSYLAKMREGFRGDWKFTLPYTADPGQGAFLFLLYLGLGHIAKWIGLPLIGVFHAARVLASIFLIWTLGWLSSQVFESGQERKIFLVLAVFGSGLGWLAAMGGMFTSDFWVAEAFPFLSMYTNPHFALGLALMVLALLPSQKGNIWKDLALGLLIGIVQPFGVIIIGAVKLSLAALWVPARRPAWRDLFQSPQIQSLIGFGLSGGAVLLYQYGAILSDPVLSGWNAQNITPSPRLADLLLSLSPPLLLAGFGIRKAWKSDLGRTAVLWAGIGLILLFVPWNLQRRFITGIYLPLSILSVFGVVRFAETAPFGKSFWYAIVLLFSIPTNLIVVASGLGALWRKDPQVFISGDKKAVMSWIQKNAEEDDLFLANPDWGLIIPPETGRRVVYGHPYETVQAEEQLAFIEDFFSGKHEGGYYQAALEAKGVDYIILSGSAEPGLAAWLREHENPVFQEGDIAVFEVSSP